MDHSHHSGLLDLYNSALWLSCNHTFIACSASVRKVFQMVYNSSCLWVLWTRTSCTHEALPQPVASACTAYFAALCRVLHLHAQSDWQQVHTVKNPQRVVLGGTSCLCRGTHLD